MTDLEKRILEESTAFARERMAGLKPSHGWDHVLRVVLLARAIREAEGADPFIVELAALLHDIGRGQEDSSRGMVCHAEAGAAAAFEFLKSRGLDETRCRNVAECIRAHRFRNSVTPQSVEARVLHDADKLDSIGAVGIGRAFLFAGEVGAKLHNGDIDPSLTQAYSGEDTAYREYCVKLRHVRERMLTREGRRIAQSRHEFMEAFFERLQAEFEGRE